MNDLLSKEQALELLDSITLDIKNRATPRFHTAVAVLASVEGGFLGFPLTPIRREVITAAKDVVRTFFQESNEKWLITQNLPK